MTWHCYSGAGRATRSTKCRSPFRGGPARYSADFFCAGLSAGFDLGTGAPRGSQSGAAGGRSRGGAGGQSRSSRYLTTCSHKVISRRVSIRVPPRVSKPASTSIPATCRHAIAKPNCHCVTASRIARAKNCRKYSNCNPTMPPRGNNERN